TPVRSEYPGGDQLPSGYWHMMDPFVSLAMAAEATSTIKLGTGICLVLEHEVLDLAKTVATLDALSGGRVILGIGVGWNAEELANARPDVPFSKRFSATRDRVAALRAAWTQDVASYEGTYDRFSPSLVFPKPAQGSVPIALGQAGPVGIRHAAEYADAWCPIDISLVGVSGERSVEGGVQLFHRLLEEAGRDPATVPISMFTWRRPKPERIESLIALGVDRLVLTPPSMRAEDPDRSLEFLDECQPVIEPFLDRSGS
ncbi:MAG: TIGR03619 family F420-dependent LLM class oxidoreductase, partial [Acidimicrobiia bacterium]|nr:TIGR03619 family F420-dependent LLM class oxidoreductase [Acidimicrobiia bacterium]